MTIRDCYPLLNIDDVLLRVAKGKVTQLDLYSGFWQIEIKNEDIEKTALVSPLGLFEFFKLVLRVEECPIHLPKSYGRSPSKCHRRVL